MKKINLNENWIYGHVGSDHGTYVNIPHDAMLSEKRTSTSKGGVNTGWYEGYDYWYERKIVGDEALINSCVILEFEGIYHNSEVYFNGEKVGSRPYGYSNFYVDLTGKIVEGENHLRVIARNADQPNSRWYSGAGIYRPVSLYVLPKEHILLNGIQIKTVNYSTGEVEITIKTNAKDTARVEILCEDKCIKTIYVDVNQSESVNLVIPNVKAWFPETPFLYQCRVTFGMDIQSVTFGVRTINVDAKNGFCINDKKIILKGACIHHDNGILGACSYAFSERRKIERLQEAGYNAIRSAHNPCSKALLKACDELGMLVMDEFVDCWYIHKTKYDYVNYFEEWWKSDLKDMVDKNFNHPSVIMYSIGNEVSETAQPKGIELTKVMTNYLHELDDSRPVTCGVNIFFNLLSSLGLGVYTDEKAQKSAYAEDRSKAKNAVGSEFYNRLAGLLGDKAMKFGATLYGCDIKTKDAFSYLDIAGYNYGILRYKKDVKKYPDRIILGTETFCKDAYQFIKLAEKHPSIIGDFVWAGMDYLGEVGIGSHEYSDYADNFNSGVGWISAGSGRIDLTGKLLAEALYTRVAFGLDEINIAVVPADRYKAPHSPSAWKMTNARDSWAWNGCDGNKVKIEIYSVAHSVRLYLNNKIIGEKKTGKHGRTYFYTKYFPGELKAIALDEAKKEIATKILVSATNHTILKILPEKTVIGTHELAYIRFKYTDEYGVLKPLARGEIKLSVSGGNLLGFGHGCPFNKDGYLNIYSDTYYGEALAIIEPLGTLIEVEATSKFGIGKVAIEVLPK
ncbi:glycoside hydrolase family 2 TIM barrel-domain containing protein [Fusibacter bizertensis]|uniref:Glycoside hydrolase family 2 TIM barrel-domain containing protein n=1 Tax=Fusibacter bizertensis TaxID=1488331 RepID=A0ABT6NHE7_9FIRM|nr:glycoside hydrolase family 2 TIM barrel-domain containing protein [Fusibacter bizertensis]MDH8679864.1 glycoside hydrolase family 2 TIM barrel-domain containing protein [Fusibacter bizertensis]